jgi:hypothetical protein
VHFAHLRGDRTIRRVFDNYTPVAFFYDNDLTSKKIAAIQLVNTGLATNIEAGEVVGLHRNTVSNAVNTNQLLGLNAVIKDDRGRKGPIYYTPEKRKHIIHLLESKLFFLILIQFLLYSDDNTSIRIKFKENIFLIFKGKNGGTRELLSPSVSPGSQ